MSYIAFPTTEEAKALHARINECEREMEIVCGKIHDLTEETCKARESAHGNEIDVINADYVAKFELLSAEHGMAIQNYKDAIRAYRICEGFIAE